MATLHLVVSKVPGAAGRFTKAEQVAEHILTARSCLETAQTVAGQAPENIDQVWDSFTSTLGLGFGCISDAWERAYGNEGVLGVFVLGIVTWLGTGVLYVVNSFHGIVDSFGYGIFVISVHPPASAGTAVVRIDPFAPDGTLRRPYTVDSSQVGRRSTAPTTTVRQPHSRAAPMTAAVPRTPRTPAGPLLATPARSSASGPHGPLGWSPARQIRCRSPPPPPSPSRWASN